MLKIDYEHFFHDQPQWQERAKKVMSKVYMATEWLQNHTELESILAKKQTLPNIVTYHDPCHAKKMQGIHQEPRNLIRQNYKIVEMSDPNACCGFGGVTMQSEKFHFAQAVGKPKAAMIKETQADVVSAECSACRMQITNSMGNEATTVFKNPIELIADALRKE